MSQRISNGVSVINEVMRYRGLDKEFKVNDHPFWTLVENERWEPRVITKLMSIVNPNDTIFDVGAWIGAYTLLLSQLAKTVVAFEPTQASRDILISNLKLNNIDNVIVEPYAVSDQRAIELIYPYNVGGFDEVLAASMANMIDREKWGEPTPVLTTTIDYYCEGGHIKPDGIKIDVEGYEGKVLAGCTQSCWKIIELHGKFAEVPEVQGDFIDGDRNYGHLFVSANGVNNG